MNTEQKNILYGHMLGDGHICCGDNNRFGLSQKEANKEYVQHTYDKLYPFTKDTKLSFREEKKSGKEYKKEFYYSYYFRTITHPIFAVERLKWYVNNMPYAQKIVPKDLKLNWQIAAIWYADDGCNWQHKKWIRLSTESFSESDNIFLIERLENDLNIKSHINKKASNFVIRIPSSSYYDFIDGVTPFIQLFDCFNYKIDTSIAKTHPFQLELIHTNETKQKATILRESGLSNIEIGNKLHISRKTIQRWLGNKNKSHAKLNKEKEEALDLWKTGNYSKAEISRLVNVHAKTVQRWLR